jgi:hypothetical protein
MSPLLYPPSRPQSVGEVLDTAFRIYGSTLLKCLPYSFASVIVGQLLSVYNLAHGYPIVRSAAAQAQQVRDPVWWLLLLVLSIGGGILANAVILRQYALASAKPADARAELARAVARVPGILLMVVLLIVAAIVIAIPCGIAAGLLAAGFGGMHSRAFPVLFVILLLIALSWLVGRFICAAPCYLLTERSATESMSYSWRLTSGNLWRLSAIYGVCIALLIVFYILTSVIGAMVAMLLAHGDITVVFAVTATIVALLAALFTPFYDAVLLAMFGDLTVRREGGDLAQRLSVAAVP